MARGFSVRVVLLLVVFTIHVLLVYLTERIHPGAAPRSPLRTRPSNAGARAHVGLLTERREQRAFLLGGRTRRAIVGGLHGRLEGGGDVSEALLARHLCGCAPVAVACLGRARLARG